MEIVLLVVLFLVGTVGGAIQALRYLERRQKHPPAATPDDDQSE